MPRPPKQVANRWEYGSMIFWAQGGGVMLIDQHPTDASPLKERSLTLRQWENRITGQFEMYLAAEADAHVIDPTMSIAQKAQQRDVWKQLIDAMMKVRDEAAAQGDCTDAAVQEHYRKHVATVRQTYQVPALILPD